MRLPTGSTRSRFRPAPGPPAGNDPPSGGCCVTRRIRAARAMGRRNYGRANASRGLCGNAKDWRAAIVPTTSGPDRIGSRLRFRPWSAKQLSPWRKSNWSVINIILPGVRSSPPCCKGCWSVSVAATRSIAPRPRPRRASFTTTGAWVPTLIVICGERFATTRRFVRITSMRWSGTNWCGCWKIRR